MAEPVDRRLFMRGAVGGMAAGAAVLAGCGRQVPENTDTTGRWLGGGSQRTRTLPSPPPGQHELMPLPYAKDGLVIRRAGKVKGISEQVVTWHHEKHHQGYVDALNTIEQRLAEMEQIEAKANYSEFTELKRRETFNASGVYLHNIYWQNMTPGGEPLAKGSALARKIDQDFGSFDRWQAEFVGTAQTPNTGWSILALAPYDYKLHTYACSFHDLGGVWGSIPLLACDVWEHAYYFDYGPDRGSYIESFLRLINWPALDAAYTAWVDGLPEGLPNGLPNT